MPGFKSPSPFGTSARTITARLTGSTRESTLAMRPSKRRPGYAVESILIDKPARKDAPAKRDGDRREELLKQHPELKEALEKLRNMSPEERQAWLKEHPEIAAKIEKARAGLKERADNLSPEQKEKLKERGENLSPEQKEKLREKMKERFEKMTPEEKAEFLKKHPELKEKLEGDKK